MGDLDFTGFDSDGNRTIPPPPGKAAATRRKTDATRSDKPQKQTTEPAKRAASRERRPRPTDEDRAATRPRKPTGQGRKKRVNVSLPVDLSRRFTDRADAEDRYLTDMVLDAYRDHYEDLRREHSARPTDDLPFRPRRRKGTTGRVTHMLYLTGPELDVLDESAGDIALSRSELVSQLLERRLG